MSDITFYCRWCRHRLVVDDAGAGMTLPCSSCGKNIVIPPKPVWLPAINEALWRIVQDDLSGKIRNARGLLRDAIVAAGYDPATACVEPNSPEDLLTFERLNLVLNTNRDIAAGFENFIQGQDETILDVWPAQELVWMYKRIVPRDSPESKSEGWGERWLTAGEASGDDNAVRMFNETGRMVALKDSSIWGHLGNDFDDCFGNSFAPFACGSGMDVEDVMRSEAEALRLLGPDDKIKPGRIVPPRLIPIEDERITEYLWSKPIPCDHCGEDRPTRLLYVCGECGGSICPNCATKGCSGPEPPPEPRDAIQCYSRAVDEMAGQTFPFEKDVAERVVHWCSRAFEFGFPAHHRDIEARAHRMLGEALESLGERERALREYELALEKDPRVGVKKRIASLLKDSTKCTEALPRGNPFAKAEWEAKPKKQEEM